MGGEWFSEELIMSEGLRLSGRFGGWFSCVTGRLVVVTLGRAVAGVSRKVPLPDREWQVRGLRCQYLGYAVHHPAGR